MTEITTKEKLQKIERKNIILSPRDCANNTKISQLSKITGTILFFNHSYYPMLITQFYI